MTKLPTLLSTGGTSGCCSKIHGMIRPMIINLGPRRMFGGHIELLVEHVIVPVGRIRMPSGQKMRGSLIIINMRNIIINVALA